MTYQVWAEGFCTLGGSGQARLLGTTEAESFEEACKTVLKDDSLFDPERMTLWGCRLFDNETDARKSFG